MNERFDRLLILRGDPVKGLPTSAWVTNLGDLDRDQVLRGAIEAVRTLLLPQWDSMRPDDKRPHEALGAAEAWLASKTPEAAANAKAKGKACTTARNETFGNDHRVPEAARAIAWSCGAKDATDIWDALTAIEGELLARITLVAEYQRAPEMRKALVETLRRVIVPKVETKTDAVSNEPVPYSFSGSFSTGQRLIHAKFGEVVVTAAGDKWIDVKLEDGTTKRLAQKPRG